MPKTSVQKKEYTVSIPNDIKLKHKALNIDIEPKSWEEEERNFYYWQTSNLKPIKYEPFSQNFHDACPQICCL